MPDTVSGYLFNRGNQLPTTHSKLLLTSDTFPQAPQRRARDCTPSRCSTIMPSAMPSPQPRNILLAQPQYTGGFASAQPPVGLGYIAASLAREGHRVSIIDANAERLGAEAVAARARGFDAEVVGVTVTTPLVSEALAIARTVPGSCCASCPGSQAGPGSSTRRSRCGNCCE